MEACFRTILAEVTWPWARTQQAIFWLKLFWETRAMTWSLEPLISFLAYLEPKLWLKNQTLGKNSIPQKVTLVFLSKAILTNQLS